MAHNSVVVTTTLPKPKREFDNSMTIALCGACGVGKSAIVLQLVSNMFTQQYNPTIEETYDTRMMVDGTMAALTLLDTSGQVEEGCGSIEEDWITAADGLVLVYDLTKPSSLLDVERYARVFQQVKQDEISQVISSIKEQHRFAELSRSLPIVLVGNKLDLAASDPKFIEFKRIAAESLGRQLISNLINSSGPPTPSSSSSSSSSSSGVPPLNLPLSPPSSAKENNRASIISTPRSSRSITSPTSSSSSSQLSARQSTMVGLPVLEISAKTRTGIQESMEACVMRVRNWRRLLINIYNNNADNNSNNSESYLPMTPRRSTVSLTPSVITNAVQQSPRPMPSPSSTTTAVTITPASPMPIGTPNSNNNNEVFSPEANFTVSPFGSSAEKRPSFRLSFQFLRRDSNNNNNDSPAKSPPKPQDQLQLQSQSQQQQEEQEQEQFTASISVSHAKRKTITKRARFRKGLRKLFSLSEQESRPEVSSIKRPVFSPRSTYSIRSDASGKIQHVISIDDEDENDEEDEDEEEVETYESSISDSDAEKEDDAENTAHNNTNDNQCPQQVSPPL